MSAPTWVAWIRRDPFWLMEPAITVLPGFLATGIASPEGRKIKSENKNDYYPLERCLFIHCQQTPRKHIPLELESGHLQR